VSTAEEPEIDIEVVKGKDRKKETANLAELVDVKGWKALGNRLSQHRVVKIHSAEEPEGPEAEREEETPAVKDASKKKSEPQAGQPKKSETPARAAKSSPAQQSLFGEPRKPEAKSPPARGKAKPKAAPAKAKAYTVGQTITLDL
jgi:topoisomerase-4 subunit A